MLKIEGRLSTYARYELTQFTHVSVSRKQRKW
jgi:hypothetical protein